MNQDATKSVLQTTVQLSLLRLVLRSRRLVHVPMLIAVHQQRRLEFSYRYRNWASNERRQEGGIYQQDIAECHTTDSVLRGSKSTRISLSYFRVQKTHLT
ncbi:hypothetical protein TNCV_2782911 [Trichonephila clavipes]|nr:hypothetical protein TNCV_2782911 [Trichonephila clavipes]